MVLKESLHQIVEELPEEELTTALKFLQYLRDSGEAPFVQTVMTADTEIEDLDLPPMTEEQQEESVADAWAAYLDKRD